MPHGYPPWSGIKKGVTTALPLDMGELAVRLGSMVTHDRRGDVVFMDSFEDGLAKWTVSPVGTGAHGVLSAQTALHGAYSAELTGGRDGDRYTELYRMMSIPVVGKVGAEVSFTRDADLDNFQLRVSIDDLTNVHRAWVRYNAVDKDFEYSDSGGVWQDIDPDKACAGGWSTFHTIKLVFDFSTDKYVRAILNDEQYDLSAHSMQTVGSGDLEQMGVSIRAYSIADKNTVSYVDSLIITQDEP